MHSPETVAFELILGRRQKKNGMYRTPLLTIWHNDPCKNGGDDDSCGWFIRCRHIDPKVIEKVRIEFAFEFKHNYWFDQDGKPKFSTMGTALEMYTKASWVIFMHQNGGKPDRKRHKRFMRSYLYDILSFAENATDSLDSSINSRFGKESDDYRMNEFVSIITADIYRKLRPWYKHPRWHVHHWSLQFHPLQALKRRYWDQCSICGKRGFKTSAHADWGGRIFHAECAGIKVAQEQAGGGQAFADQAVQDGAMMEMKRP